MPRPRWSRLAPDVDEPGRPVESSGVTPEDALVWHCCRAFPDAPDPARLEALGREVSWSRLLATCRENRIVGYVAERLTGLSSTPPGVKRALLQEVLSIRVGHRRSREVFEEALPLVLEHHQVILLRGIAHAYSLHSARTVRSTGDIDLLIDRPARFSEGGWMRVTTQCRPRFVSAGHDPSSFTTI